MTNLKPKIPSGNNGEPHGGTPCRRLRERAREETALRGKERTPQSRARAVRAGSETPAPENGRVLGDRGKST